MNILNKDFKYVNAANTDIRKTFERARIEMMHGDVQRLVNNALKELEQIRERL